MTFLHKLSNFVYKRPPMKTPPHRQRGRRSLWHISAKTPRRTMLLLEALEDRLALSTITDLGVLPGASSSSAFGINASGQVVGVSGSHAFLYSDGQMTDLGTLPGETESSALSINASGQVVGNSGSRAFLYSNGQMKDLGAPYASAFGINVYGEVAGGYGPHAFLYNGGFTELGTLPGDTESYATGISDTGSVVGVSSHIGGTHAFIYSSGKMSDLGTLPGYTDSKATGVNEYEQVVGYSVDSSGEHEHAFLFSNRSGQMTDLGTLPGDTYSYATAINNSGQVVGHSLDSSLDSRAFLYSHGQMIDLNSLLPTNSGWLLTSAEALNDSDQIVGQGTINGHQHAFLLDLSSVPSITSNPSDQTVTAGQKAVFGATANGPPEPTQQWQVSTDGGTTFTNISGATHPTLTLDNVTASMNGYEYRAVFTNSVGTTPTTAATLAVQFAPAMTVNPANQTVTAGQAATFTTSASGNPTPTIQWQVSTDHGETFNDISGATNLTLTLTSVTTAQNGYQYRAVFTNSIGSITTSIATLTVNSLSTSPPPSPLPAQPPSPPAPKVPPLLALFNQFLGGLVTVNPNGTTITDNLFGFPLVETYDYFGNLMSVTLIGFNITFLFG